MTLIQDHLIDDEVYSDDLPPVGGAITLPTMLDGEDLLIEVTSDGVIINGVALVIETDLVAINGVVHVIDAVLVPGDDAPPTGEVTPPTVPTLPRTGFGPESTTPWGTVAIVAVMLGLAFAGVRKYGFARAE